ncbi:MAG: F0F1 ATP synthase subunit alpha, partial [Lentilactobacillus parabuchneri]|nr:F0F1 ATP synthase subunit alpha [Lentilactobacillus parabuchneri]
SHKDLLDEITKTGQLPDTGKLDAAIKEFEQTFQPSKSDDQQAAPKNDQNSAASND